jgi:outer membrane protein OmpA-like peptidoglycan-associated protein
VFFVGATMSARADGFDAQLYQGTTSSSGYLTLESGRVLPQYELDLGATLDFAHDPLVARDPATGERLMDGDIVASRFGMQLTAGYGLTRRLELGVALPLVLAQNGDPATLAAGRTLSTTALGDARLFGKLQVAQTDLIAVAAALDVTAPTGDPTSFTGSSTASARPRLVLDLHHGALGLALNTGYRFRGRSQVANVVVDDEVTAGIALAYAARPSLWLLAEGFVAIGVSGEDHATPAEALVGARTQIVGPWQVQLALGEGLGRGYGTPAFEAVASLGYLADFAQHAPPVEKQPPPPPPVDPDRDHDGIINEVDACPDEPEDKDGFEDTNGCPDPDNDFDGLLDANDQCPVDAEDKDGFQDDDGCPELDNDGDGIADAKDACPNEPETRNGFEDADGCPDEIPVPVKRFVGVIQGINFKLGSADLLPGATKVLDSAVAVLNEYPDLKLQIQGHTDDQSLGKRSKFKDNDELSQARADAVASYLSAMGVSASRLTARGFGAQQPLEDPTGLKGTKLNAARAKNRRVEFQIIVEPAPVLPSTPAPSVPPASATPPGNGDSSQ